jgi:hypothetical protein
MGSHCAEAGGKEIGIASKTVRRRLHGGCCRGRRKNGENDLWGKQVEAVFRPTFYI